MVKQAHSTRVQTQAQLSFLLVFYTISTFINLIFSIPLNGMRCLHIPPPPDNVKHLWLNDSSFRIDRPSELPSNSFENQYPSKAKREILHDSDHLMEFISSSSQRKRIYSSKDDLVPMKIQVHYDDSLSAMDQDKQDLITKYIMPEVTKFFESVLSLKREFAIDKFRISRRCPNNTVYYARNPSGLSRPYCMNRCEDYAVCGEILVPSAHLAGCSYCNSTTKLCITNNTNEIRGSGETQLLLYVSAKQTPRCQKDQTIAYAAHCAQDTKTDRPVAGHANLCPNSISTDLKELKSLIATVKHELTHVLGFSVSLFAYYRDQSGKPYIGRDSILGPIPVDPKTGYAKWSERVIKKVVRNDWVTGEGIVEKEAHMIVTPTVVREVRNHFNCSTLEGAELEDQGSDGTSMTHWEKRLFENEAMTGTHTQNSIYSRLTLAILQDTGWYVANFTKAEKLDWGRDLGCDFAQKSCKSWIDARRAQGQSIKPFCDRPKSEFLQISCTEDRSSKAVCNMKYYKEPLPQVYRNFDQLPGVANSSLAYLGGSVDLADYCPFIQEFTWQAHNVSVRGSRCDFAGNSLESDRNPSLEHYGLHSKCFEHGGRWEQRSCSIKRHWHHYGAGCYRYVCEEGHLKVRVGDFLYTCYYADQIIHIGQLRQQWLFNGTIVCPACEQLCPLKTCKIHDRTSVNEISDHDQQYYEELINKGNSNLAHVESHNSIETSSSDQGKLKRAFQRQSTSKIEQNISNGYSMREFLGQGHGPPRQELVCSSSSRHSITAQISWISILCLSLCLAMRANIEVSSW